MESYFDNMHAGSARPAVGDVVPLDNSNPLVSLRMSIAEVAHEINNPLAIISGNAQLLLELVRMMDLDADVAKPIRDIEEASRRLAASVGRLNAIRESICEDPPSGDGV